MNLGDLSDKDLNEMHEQVEALKEAYIRYSEEVGLERTCSYIRQQGQEISLMAEIVFTSQVSDLYPKISPTESTKSMKK